MKWLDGTTDLMDINLCKLWELVKPGMLQSMGLQRVRYDSVTELNCPHLYISILRIITINIYPEYSLEGLILKLKL